ncbi:zinc finger BED domain-containing protein DAYSLEEPER-like [Rhizophagus clarus]|uniref:Zinc finger BED domain-containing protein DAYSLEEPER-like n=1 Tax=Rhizophagus clarus TaxID=94130 RepID=A0A8H3R0C5_9GLOM|nr:zinc finger BED domain-containing protein DAYSLEEPER-like [Rhizophagus clarus]
MIKRLNSNAIIPSSDTIHNDIIKIFNDEKEFLKNKLQKLSEKISLTLDRWTSKNQISFLGITIHWITDDWKFNSTVLDFSHLEGISTDNASNMDKMFNKFEYICNYEGIKFDANNQRVHCLAQIINLAVQNILKALKGEAPENENEILQENVSIGSILGVVTKPLHNLVAADKELFSYLLNSIKWDKLNEIQGLLECFQKATIEMSSENSPTLDQTVPIYNYLIDTNIEDFLEETNTKSNDVINAANDAKSKLLQYYLKIYFNEPPENFDMDILAFWKVHENKFPNLSKMAKDFLAIPGTSVPVKRVFSGGTDLVTQRRCSLNLEIIRKSICLKA